MRSTKEYLSWSYIGIFTSILLLQGFIDYATICNGESLNCYISFNKITRTIISLSLFLIPFMLYLNRRGLINFNYKKNLPLIGVIGYISIIILGTKIFNYYWFSKENNFVSLLSLNKSERTSYISTYINFLIFSATLLAPLVVYQMYENWKHQEAYKISIDLINNIHNKIRELQQDFTKARDSEDDFTIFLYYTNSEISKNIDDMEWINQVQKKYLKIIESVEDIAFLVDKIIINQNINSTEIDAAIELCYKEAVSLIQDFKTFNAATTSLKYGKQIINYGDLKPICKKLDYFTDISNSSEDELYEITINNLIKNLVKALRNIKEQI